MPHRQLLAAALAAFAIGILMQPVRAAPGPTAVECVSLDADVLAAKTAGSVATHVYRGPAAALFLSTAIEVYGDPPVDLSATKAIATFVISADPHIPVQIRFYDSADCIIWAVTTQAGGLAEIIMEMGPSI